MKHYYPKQRWMSEESYKGGEEEGCYRALKLRLEGVTNWLLGLGSSTIVLVFIVVLKRYKR